MAGEVGNTLIKGILCFGSPARKGRDPFTVMFWRNGSRDSVPLLTQRATTERSHAPQLHLSSNPRGCDSCQRHALATIESSVSNFTVQPSSRFAFDASA